MMTESITIQGLHVISLALTPSERWEASRSSFNTDSAAIACLTAFAVVALIISLVLLCWVFTKHRRSENRLNLRVTELTIANIELRQENDELTATNEKLKQENTVLHQKQVELLENVIDAKTPGK